MVSNGIIYLKHKALGRPSLNQIDLFLKINKIGGFFYKNVLEKGC